MADPRHVLLTGVTGLVGAELLRALLRQDPGLRVTCLIRSRGDQPPAARLAPVLRTLPAEPPPIVDAVAGDLEVPGFGLAPRDRAALTETLTDIVHCAASVRFDLPLEEARRVNLGGTRAAIELARASPHIQRLDAVSTAYVVGSRTGLVTVHDAVMLPFHNTYEQSKHEAEGLLLEAHSREGLPVTIFRPSIVVGHSQTGFSPNQHTLYWPLRILATGRWRLVPGRPDSRFDIVPVDYVCEALVALRNRTRPIGSIFPITAGPLCAATAGQIARLAADAFQAKQVLWVNPTLYLRVLRPVLRALLRRRRADVFRNGAAFLPYLSSDLVFDDQPTALALAGTGIAPPRVEDYFSALFDWCKASDFGRRVGEVGR